MGIVEMYIHMYISGQGLNVIYFGWEVFELRCIGAYRCIRFVLFIVRYDVVMYYVSIMSTTSNRTYIDIDIENLTKMNKGLFQLSDLAAVLRNLNVNKSIIFEI